MSATLSDGTRLRVTAGHPTPEEIAVLLVALAGQDPALHDPSPQADVPAWSRAARREALGHPPVATPADLHHLW